MWLLTNGLGTLMAIDVVRPSLDFVLGARLNHTWSHLLTWRHDPNADVLRRVRCTPQTRAAATGLLGRLVVVTGREVAELRAGDLVAYRSAVLTRRNQTVGLGHLWLCLADLGTVEGTLAQALRPGRRSVTELVDRYNIASRAVQGLMIAYLTERSVCVDYSTLRSLVTELCLVFWKQVEQIAPGIDTIELPDEVAAKWKQAVRWRAGHDGNLVAPRGVLSTLMTVRGFYGDLIQLAHEEPARWATWACRAPVSESEVKAYRKWRLSLRSETHERTRARAVRVGELADAAERNYHQVRVLLDAARTAGAGKRFSVGPATFVRLDQATHELAHPKSPPSTPTASPPGTVATW